MKRRPRVKHTLTFEQRLLGDARECREQAKLLGPGAERERLLRRARQAEAAADINSWLSAPGSPQPK